MKQNKQPQWNLIRPSKSETSFLLVRTAWDPEVTDLFRYCVYATVCHSCRFSSYSVTGPPLMCIPDGPALASSTRRQSVFYSQQLAGCFQQSGCSVFVTQLLEPGLSLQCHHLSLPYMSHHSCWTNCNSLTTLCPYFPHGSLQTPFRTLTASFPRSIFQPTLPPSTQIIFLHSAHFQCWFAPLTQLLGRRTYIHSVSSFQNQTHTSLFPKLMPLGSWSCCQHRNLKKKCFFPTLLSLSFSF